MKYDFFEDVLNGVLTYEEILNKYSFMVKNEIDKLHFDNMYYDLKYHKALYDKKRKKAIAL